MSLWLQVVLSKRSKNISRFNLVTCTDYNSGCTILKFLEFTPKVLITDTQNRRTIIKIRVNQSSVNCLKGGCWSKGFNTSQNTRACTNLFTNRLNMKIPVKIFLVGWCCNLCLESHSLILFKSWLRFSVNSVKLLALQQIGYRQLKGKG